MGAARTGKTTLARLLAQAVTARFVAVSAVQAAVKELRQEIDEARTRLTTYGERTILFVDEIHRFNKSQQDALLPHVEAGTSADGDARGSAAVSSAGGAKRVA